jgi:hypothetical protein
VDVSEGVLLPGCWLGPAWEPVDGVLLPPWLPELLAPLPADPDVPLLEPEFELLDPPPAELGFEPDDLLEEPEEPELECGGVAGADTV